MAEIPNSQLADEYALHTKAPDDHGTETGLQCSDPYKFLKGQYKE